MTFALSLLTMILQELNVECIDFSAFFYTFLQFKSADEFL